MMGVDLASASLVDDAVARAAARQARADEKKLQQMLAYEEKLSAEQSMLFEEVRVRPRNN